MNELQDKVILLVEDDAIIALGEEAMLRRNGLNVVKAHSGRQAISAFEKGRQIDLVLMDIDLGKGMDGTEAASRILQDHDVPIVFLTSHTESEYVDRTDAISSYGYVVKNSGEMVIIRSIIMALRLHGAHKMVRTSRNEIAREAERYHLLFTNLTAGFALHEMIYDEDGNAVDYRFLDVNPAFETITGLAASLIVGRTVCEVLPGTEKYWIDTYAGVVKTGQPISYENYSARLGRYYDVWAFRHGQDKFATVISDITRGKRVEEELRKQRENLSTMLDAMGDGVISTDREGRVVVMNPVAEQLTGWDVEGAEGRKFSEVFVLEDALSGEKGDDPVEMVLAGGRAVNISEHSILVSRDGGRYHIAVSATPIINGDQETEGVVIVFRDVSEDYRKNREIAANNRYLEGVIESVQEGITVLDRSFSIERTNDTAKGWFSRGGDIVGRKCYELYRNRSERCEDCPVARAIQTGRPEHAELQGYGDAPVEWIEAFAFPVRDPETGRIERVVEFQRDITERKRRERLLTDQAERYGSIFRDGSAAMLIIDPRDGSIVDANAAAVEFYGWTLDQLKEMTVFDINALSPEEIANEMERARALRKRRFTFRHRRADGSERAVVVISGPVEQDGSTLLHSIVLENSDEEAQQHDDINGTD